MTQAWIAARLIEHGHGAVVIDPEGDAQLRDALHGAARRARRTFREWTPEGPAVYNPFAHGTDTEFADKALAGEHYSEPHYLRQAQRYLGHATRALRASGQPVTLGALTAVMEPDRLDRTARQMPQPDADRLHAYLDTLSGEQRRGLAGTRDRLAILAESDVAGFLEPRGPTRHNLDLLSAVQHGDVVYFRLDADRRPLMASMLAAAIVSDLLTVAAHQQEHPRPTLVLVDEFSAVSPDGVARLFGRGRSAGLSLLLGTQELADLHPPDNPGLADQVLGNITTLIAHRQVVPDSAEAIAGVAGTRGGLDSHPPHRPTPHQPRAGDRHQKPRPRIRRAPRRHQTTPNRLGARRQPRPRPAQAHQNAAPTGGAMTTLNGHDPATTPRLDTPLLKPEQAAELLAVRVSWIYDAVRTGRLPCLRLGKHIRFTRQMLEDWLARQP